MSISQREGFGWDQNSERGTLNISDVETERDSSTKKKIHWDRKVENCSQEQRETEVRLTVCNNNNKKIRNKYERLLIGLLGEAATGEGEIIKQENHTRDLHCFPSAAETFKKNQIR